MYVAVAAADVPRPDSEKTRAAIDRSALTGIERYSCCRLAAIAVSPHLDPVTFTRYLGHFYGLKTQVLGLLAFFASFRRILEVFIAEESLLASCPNKIVFTVDAGDQLVRKSVAGF